MTDYYKFECTVDKGKETEIEFNIEICKVWMLKTSDAHGLYKQFGYSELKHPEKVMERLL